MARPSSKDGTLVKYFCKPILFYFSQEQAKDIH